MADSTIGIAQGAAGQAGSTVGDALQAYHVASTAENARQELEMEKQNNQINKANFVMQQLDKIGRTVGPAQDIMLDSFGKHMQTIQPGFDPSTLQVLKKDPEAIKNFAWAASQGLGKGGAKDADQANSILQTFGNLDSFTGYMGKIGEMKTQVEAGQAKAAGMQGRVDEMRNQNAVSAGHAFEADPIIKGSKTNINKMNQSSAILVNPNKPVTSKDFAAAYYDYLGGTAVGGSPTEGKANREIPDTFEQEWNTVKQKLGVNDDMRKSPAGRQLISMLSENIRTSQNELKSQLLDQVDQVHSNYATSTNQRAKDIADQKKDTYYKLYGTPKSAATKNTTAPQGKVLNQAVVISQIKTALAQGHTTADVTGYLQQKYNMTDDTISKLLSQAGSQ